MIDDCFICGHLLQGEIDAMIQKWDPESLMDDEGGMSLLGRINDLIERTYGVEARQAELRDVRVHALKHPMITTEGEIAIYEDTQMVRIGDKYLPIPTLRQAVVTLIALGLENIRLRPDTVQPHHTIKVMQLAKQLGMTLGQEELEDVLRARIAQPRIPPAGDSGENPFLPPDVE